MESLLERLDGWLTTSDRYPSSLCQRLPIVNVLLLYYLFSVQSGIVIATELLEGRSSTLIIIQNSGCLQGLLWSRLLCTSSEGSTLLRRAE